jgi:hypothetical protein
MNTDEDIENCIKTPISSGCLTYSIILIAGCVFLVRTYFVGAPREVLTSLLLLVPVGIIGLIVFEASREKQLVKLVRGALERGLPLLATRTSQNFYVIAYEGSKVSAKIQDYKLERLQDQMDVKVEYDEFICLNSVGLQSPEASLSDVKLYRRGGNEDFDSYRSQPTLDTLLGKMYIEVMVRKGSTASEEHLEVLKKFTRKVAQEQNELLEVVYTHYKIIEEDNGLAGVPKGLSPSDIIPHLRDQCLCVSVPYENESDFDCYLFIRPEWDEEHCIYIRCTDGKWEQTDPC